MDKCLKCNTRTRVEQGPLQFENDDTPDKPTIAYTPQLFLCDNKDLNGTGIPCANFGTVVDIVLHRMN